MEIKAHAKLNLSLDVLERRPDGYHNLRSIFQFISLHDVVTLEKAEQNTFWCSDAALNNQNNLAEKARALLAEEYPVGPTSIKVEKHIPSMAGMGGGSADGAAVLNGLNRLWQLNIPQDKLLALGARLGADVPACIVGGLLQADGIGEIITPMHSQKTFWFNVIKPDVAFSTPEMFRKLGRTQTAHTPRSIASLMQALQQGDALGVAANLFNSFEDVAEPKEPIQQARAALLQTGALGACMTGSGSAVFGIYGNQQAALEAFQSLKQQGNSVFCCQSVQTEE